MTKATDTATMARPDRRVVTGREAIAGLVVLGAGLEGLARVIRAQEAARHDAVAKLAFDGLREIGQLLGTEFFAHVAGVVSLRVEDERPPMTQYATAMFTRARKLRAQAEVVKQRGRPIDRKQASALLREAQLAEHRGAASQQARLDRIWNHNAALEAAKLAAGRGDVIEVSRTGGAARRINGIDWLLSKGRLDSYQHQAAERYGTDYTISGTVPLPSGMREATGGTGDAAQVKRTAAAGRLASARKVGLKGHKGMTDICDAVCGEGKRVRQISMDEAQAQKNEAVLIVALDLLVEHYGIL